MSKQIKGSWGRRGALLLVCLVGCGAAPVGNSKPVAPPPSSEREPKTIEEAEDLLKEGEAKLSRFAEQGSPDAQPPDRPPGERPTIAGKSEPVAPLTKEEHQGPCMEACRALASMRRAAETICRLAGPDDARCQSARRRVQDGSERAAPCGC